ncbi:MBL fold metallo-hydrolase [Rhizobium halophytocola]|uniref:L-ascorbate metabolism protein UlaG (Beta-lactamase superfamily) n=1 Tax=Rhizobium halophytocola TaxID=735519 RepID=A0ABS4DT44_9HYPH|nr:MBL fold metallo-hydrolase [Rhizobium halophytocola]MBP1848866.1 L-ascorbate metabolism protein UlaG (beta-lactamase superfamily) [Rhizobium halophytocola]
MKRLRLAMIAVMAGLSLSGKALAANDRPPASQCQLVAEGLPHAQFARFDDNSLPIQLAGMRDEVVITFVGHSTFRIVTPQGLTIETDYSGSLRSADVPDVVTMNKAHSSHYTLYPDPAITHVLHGWSDVPGEKADWHEVVADAYIRNVTTDIRSFGGVETDANSIFIFEVAGLCIGHLGHLHYELTETHYAEIGRLDVVMVPVDGGLTMGAISMSKVIDRLRSALILPMHRRGPPLDGFLAMFDARFDVSVSDTDSVAVSMRHLPKKPLILVLRGF